MPKDTSNWRRCTIDGCDKFVSRVGLCSFHAYRQEKWGDPLYSTTPEAKYWRNVPCGAINECWPWQGRAHDKVGYGSTQALAGMPTKTAKAPPERALTEAVSYGKHPPLGQLPAG